jgi:hypothetical protein
VILQNKTKNYFHQTIDASDFENRCLLAIESELSIEENEQFVCAVLELSASTKWRPAHFYKHTNIVSEEHVRVCMLVSRLLTAAVHHQLVSLTSVDLHSCFLFANHTFFTRNSLQKIVHVNHERNGHCRVHGSTERISTAACQTSTVFR